MPNDKEDKADTTGTKTDTSSDTTGTQDSSFTIELVDKIENEEIRNIMKTMIQQNQTLVKSNEEMKAIITKQETERELKKYEDQRTELYNNLKKIAPKIAETHKDTKDLGILKTALDTAQAMKEKVFPEYTEQEKEGKEKAKQYITPEKYNG